MPIIAPFRPSRQEVAHLFFRALSGRRVREMLPAYRAFFARYEMEQDMANVTPLRPNKE